MLDNGVADLLGGDFGAANSNSANTPDLLGTGGGMPTGQDQSNDLLGAFGGSQPAASTQYSLDGMMGSGPQANTAGFLDSFQGSTLLNQPATPAISLNPVSELDSERFQQLWM